jgi:prophage regulatory protein
LTAVGGRTRDVPPPKSHIHRCIAWSEIAQGDSTMKHTILRLPAVKQSTGLSRSTIYLRVAEGTFPRPVSLGGRSVGWVESEIQEWLQRRIDASRK